jgi:hypothetical protein
MSAGEDAERWMARLKSPLDGWTRQRSMTKSVSGVMLSAFARGASSSTTARRAPETRIYYKCDDERTLSVRVETVIARDLLVPLLSVLNESELYSEWLPRWTTPTRLGVRSSEKVAQVGRCSQLVVIGTLWGAFIRVAEEVREGKRPIHAEVIAQKRAALYDWIEERAEQMFVDKLE